ncbi:lipopolysaccharide biosynthesis protein [Asprobacillus argus]
MFRGTVISQIVAILGSLYLAKLYGANAYGIFGVFISITSIFSIINTLQLEKNVVTAKTIDKSKNWYAFLTFSSPLVAGLFLLVFYGLYKADLLQNIDTNVVLWSFLGSVFVALFVVNESFFIYRKKFKLLSNSKVLLTFINVALQVILFYKYQFYGLIYGYVISQCIIVLYFYVNNIKFVGFPVQNDIKNDLKANNTIIKFLLPGNAINAFAIHLMPIFIAAFFSEEQAGVYFFVTKLLTAPLFLISSSVSQVYFQKASELYHSKRTDILKMTKKIVKGNLLIMLFILLLINTVAMYFLEWYLDPEWENIRFFTLILSFLILARTSFNPISSLMIILNKNHISLWFNIYLFLVNIIAIYVGYVYADITIAVSILSLFGGVGYLVLLLYFLKLLKNLENV